MSDLERTILLLLTFLLPPLINWFANAMPTDRTSLGFLGAALLTALLIFIQRRQETKALKKLAEAAKSRLLTELAEERKTSEAE